MFSKKVAAKESDIAPGVTSPDPELVKESSEDFIKSAEKLEALRDGRNLSDIPLSDAYWEFQNAHTLAHNKHIIRTDEAQLVKGKPVDKRLLATEE